MNVLSYDIEIFEELDLTTNDLSKVQPSIAAIALNTYREVMFYYTEPRQPMSRETAQKLVKTMMFHYGNGFVPFGWNTTSFDFRILAQTSGMYEECGELALNGVDGMLMVTFNKGYFLGLDTALAGAGVESKVHELTLSDGTSLTGITGKDMPRLWREGEVDAVKTYLTGDILRPLDLAEVLQERKGIQWTAKTGGTMYCAQEFVPVKNLFSIPVPDTSWMKSPAKPRSAFVDWIPASVMERNKVTL